MRNRIIKTEIRCFKLESEIDHLKIMPNNKEQIYLNQYIEITGITKTVNENIPNI